MPICYLSSMLPFSQLKMTEGKTDLEKIQLIHFTTIARKQPEILGERTNVILNLTTYWKQKIFPKSGLPEQKHRIQNSERLDKYFK